MTQLVKVIFAQALSRIFVVRDKKIGITCCAVRAPHPAESRLPAIPIDV